MENINCKMCGSDQAAHLLTCRDYRLDKTDTRYDFVKCCKCGLIYQNPRPATEEMDDHYNKNTLYPAVDKNKKIQILIKNYGLRKRARTITRIKDKGVLLDIGCGDGSFLRYLNEHTMFDVMGTEINEQYVDLIKQEYGIAVKFGDLNQLNLPGDHFDVITMWDILEHVSNPKQMLEETKRVLKPDGILLLRVPNGDSLDYKIFGKYWAGIDAPRHFFILTRASISNLLEATDFSIITSRNDIGSYLNFINSLEFWLNDVNINPHFKAFVFKFLKSIIIRILVTPLFWIKDFLFQGTSMTIVCQPIHCPSVK